MKFYEINQQIQAIVENADPVTGEVDMMALVSLELEKEEKLNGILFYVKSQEVYQIGLDAEIQRLKKIQTVMENRRERLLSFILGQMQIDGEKERVFGAYKATIKQNPPSVIVDNEEAIPAKFKTQVISEKIDKMAIKEAIKSGDEVAGARLESKNRISIN